MRSIFNVDLKIEHNIIKHKNMLHHVVKQGQWDTAKSIIITHGDINIIYEASESTGLTSIHVAIDVEKEDIIQNLFATEQKSLEARDSWGYTSLAFAANQYSEEKKIVEWLINEGENDLLTMEITSNGQTKSYIPVILATTKGHKKLTKYLLLKMNWNYMFFNDSYCADKLLTLCIHA